LDLFGGPRYFDVSTTSVFDPVNESLPTVSRSHDAGFTDSMSGARYTATHSRSDSGNARRRSGQPAARCSRALEFLARCETHKRLAAGRF